MSEKEQQFERIYKETENFGRTQFVREIQMQINDNKKKDKEIERLNNIINDFEEELKRELNIKEEDTDLKHNTYIDINNTLKAVLKRFKELKGDGSNE